MNKNIRDDRLSHGDYNIIVVDWAHARSIDYISSVVAVLKVGKKVADIIDCLVQNHGLCLKDTEVISHCLGAQVAGYTGKNFDTGMLQAIVPLEYALPLYSYKKQKKRLNSGDVTFIKSIQTKDGQLGVMKTMGKGVFCLIGGKKQPSCGLDLTDACSHARSCVYYAEAVTTDNFICIK